MSTSENATDRRRLLGALAEAGRVHSDATVLLHSALASRVGVNPTDWKTMSVLQRRGALSAGDIARETGLTTAAVTALIDRLEGRNLVRRRPDPADRRKVMVEVVPEAVHEFRMLLAPTARSLARLWQSYPNEELAVILDFLQRSAKRLHAETTRLSVTNAPRPSPVVDA